MDAARQPSPACSARLEVFAHLAELIYRLVGLKPFDPADFYVDSDKHRRLMLTASGVDADLYSRLGGTWSWHWVVAQVIAAGPGYFVHAGRPSTWRVNPKAVK